MISGTNSGSPGARIAAKSVSKTFADGLSTLEAVSLEVEPGEFVALLGPSGCGKTTFLRVAAGLEPLSEGRITVERAASDRPAEIGYVFQTPTLMPWASVLANVRLPLTLRKQPRKSADADAKAALANVGLADFAEALPRQLSGGMAMRASLARALVTKPNLLLLDEPFAALDEMTRFRLGDELMALQAEQQFTVLFVTHSLYEAAFLADRIAVFSPRPGRIIGEVKNTAARPRRPDYRTSQPFQELVEELRRLLSGNAEPSSSPQNMS
nr:ABC transporter ATP-binding protein [Afifella sp. H1R]